MRGKLVGRALISAFLLGLLGLGLHDRLILCVAISGVICILIALSLGRRGVQLLKASCFLYLSWGVSALVICAKKAPLLTPLAIGVIYMALRVLWVERRVEKEVRAYL